MKNLTAIVLFMLANAMIYAQSTPPAAIAPPSNYQAPTRTFKFKGGLMVSPFVGWTPVNVDDPTKNSISSKGAQIGFSYGLLGDFFFSNNYGISANLRVSDFNSEFKYNPGNSGYYTINGQGANVVSIDRTLHLQYIDLPITLKMRTNEVGYMKYFAQFGVMPAVQLGTKGDIDTVSNKPLNGGGSASVTGSVKGLNVTNDVNLFMLYSVIGVGAEYNLGGTTSLVVSITWNNGFTNIWNKKNDNSTANPPVFSNFNSPEENISLNLGVLF